MLKRILKELGSPYPAHAKDFIDAEWVAGRLVELLPLELAQKQALLELDDPLSRLFRLRDNLLNLEIL
jgi:Lon protease-like protein